MKMNKLFTALVLASGMAAFGAQADQGSGVVTFTGSVIDAPCSIAAGDEDQTISLGQVSSSRWRTAVPLRRFRFTFTWKTALLRPLPL